MMTVDWEEASVRIMRAAEITTEQVVRLEAVRVRVADGTLNEDTLESRRLVFARWLWSSGRLEERWGDGGD